MKKRADILLVEKGLVSTRQKAQAIILSGEVRTFGKKVLKPSELFDENTVFEIESGLKYVSRGGLKLEKAIQCFDIDLNGCICIDIGSSTGGFTDCMLQNGAQKVYAVDVGYGQLDWSLRSDSRVTVMERTNARYLDPEMFQEEIGFISVDVSFISLKLIFPAIKKCLKEAGSVLTLIKPQFEAGKGYVGKNGVVRDSRIHTDVLNSVITNGNENGFALIGLDYSPITGPKGNIEFLAYWTNQTVQTTIDMNAIKKVVNEAHSFHGITFE